MNSDLRVADLFAGCGGTSEGARLAGMRVVWAGNHWAEAVALHRRRHGDAIHVCQDLHQYNWRHLPDHDILWASPACQGHSEAAQPARARDASLAAEHDSLRATMWSVVAAVMAKTPRAFVVENVREVQEWTTPDVEIAAFSSLREAEQLAARLNDVEPKPGPNYLVVKRRKSSSPYAVIRRGEPGAMFRHWLNTFRLAGYRITVQVVNSAKWLVPQLRHRLIIVGHLEREVPIIEPKLDRKDYATLEPILDFDAGDWGKIADMPDWKAGARARAQHALATFEGEPCWGWNASHVGAWARSPSIPANTITTQNQHYMVRGAANGGEYRLWSVSEYLQAQSFAPDYLDGVDRTAAIVMTGNAVPPLLARGVLLQVAEAA